MGDRNDKMTEQAHLDGNCSADNMRAHGALVHHEASEVLAEAKAIKCMVGDVCELLRNLLGVLSKPGFREQPPPPPEAVGAYSKKFSN